MTKRVFIDTSAWLAYLLTGEKNHQVIDAQIKKLIATKAKLFTSDYVLDESWTRLITSQSLSSARSLRHLTKEAQKTGYLSILFTLEPYFEETWDIFVKFSDHKLSFTDASIILFARKFKLDEIITLDIPLKTVYDHLKR